MRYFVLNGYLPSPHADKRSATGRESNGFGRSPNGTIEARRRRYKEAGWEAPSLGARIFLSQPNVGTISVFVYGVLEALILVKARSQRRAYALADALRGVLTTVFGTAPVDNLHCRLLELAARPSPKMTRSDLARLIAPLGTDHDLTLLEATLRSGTFLDNSQIAHACAIVSKALESPNFLDCIQHLEHSYSLFWGFMVGSYYESHYSREDRRIGRYDMEKRYFENRITYELAFLSAFRGLEALLNVPQMKKDNIADSLAKLDSIFDMNFSRSRYRAFHLVFSRRKKWWRYEEIIRYLLVLRNSVAAHANPMVPKIVMEDQVLEVQYLGKQMLLNIVSPEKES